MRPDGPDRRLPAATYAPRRSRGGVVRTQNEAVYAPEHLAEQRVFTSVLTVTYRTIG